MLTIAAFLWGMQAIMPPSAGAYMSSGDASTPASHCKDCGKGMQGTQCIAVCVFTALPSQAPTLVIAAISARLRPALAAIPIGWSVPPETAPPRA